jgi:hypothetical protein
VAEEVGQDIGWVKKKLVIDGGTQILNSFLFALFGDLLMF